MFMLAAGYTLKHNGHVRIDIFYNRFGARGRRGSTSSAACCSCCRWRCCWPGWRGRCSMRPGSRRSTPRRRRPAALAGETAAAAGFGLLALQGVAEVIKRIGVLGGHLVLPREAPEEEV